MEGGSGEVVKKPPSLIIAPRYLGKWVGLHPKTRKVLASSKTFEGLYKRLFRKGALGTARIYKPVVFRNHGQFVV